MTLRLRFHLAERVTDTFTAPRWLHHVVKIVTGALVFAICWLASRHSVPVGATLSVVWFLTLRVSYALDHGTPLVKPDLWCDGALHVIAIAGWLGLDYGLALVAVCLGAYLLTVQDAEP